MFNLILKRLVPIPSIEECKTVVFIGPHPDDIEIGCGAMVSYYKRRGAKVIFIVATDGGCGITKKDHTIEYLVSKRQVEQEEACKVLNIDHLHFLNFPDGGDYIEEDVAKEIAKLIVLYNPEVVFAPDPDLPNEIHPDHLKVARASRLGFFLSTNTLVLKRNGLKSDGNNYQRNLVYYYTHRVNKIVKVTKSDVNKMYEAILKHESQFKDVYSDDFKALRSYLNLRLRKFGLRKFSKYGMGFFAMASVHQHCFSEINEW